MKYDLPTEPTQVMLKAATTYSNQCHALHMVPSGKGYYEAMVKAQIEDIKADWRSKGFYESNKPCCICGSTDKIGIEPRFNYSVCEQHSKLSPVQVTYRTVKK
jgi:hypothetical protein